MATLIRSKSESRQHDRSSTLSDTIPAPLTAEERAILLGQDDSAAREDMNELNDAQDPFRDQIAVSVEVEPTASPSKVTQVRPILALLSFAAT